MFSGSPELFYLEV
jgi:hypothetical protein